MDERSKILEQLSAYIDGELSDAEVERVDQALAADASLAAELESLRRTRDAVRHLPRKNAGPDFVANVLAQAERLRLVMPHGLESPERSFQWVRYLATAAVLLVAGGVGTVITAMLWTTPSVEHVNRRTLKSSDVDTVAVMAPMAKRFVVADSPVSVAELTLANSEVMYSRNLDETVELVSRELSCGGIEPAAISKSSSPDRGEQVRILAYVPVDKAASVKMALRGIAAPSKDDVSDKLQPEESADKDAAKALKSNAIDGTAIAQQDRSRSALNGDFNHSQTMCGLGGNNFINNGSQQVSPNPKSDVQPESEGGSGPADLKSKSSAASDRELFLARQISTSQLPAQPMVIIINSATPPPASGLAFAGEPSRAAVHETKTTGGGSSAAAASSPCAKPASQPASQPASAPSSQPAK